MQIAQPPGVRSCRSGDHLGEGGTWDHVGDPALPTPIGELRAVLDACAPVDRAVLFEEVRVMLDRAARGELEFVRGAGRDRAGDVDLMEVTRCVLELRLTTRTGASDGKRHVRFYFVEPARREGLLLGLKVASKSPGRIGLGEQTGHAVEARGRAEAWEITVTQN
jgi:hypothetical protein